MVALFFSVYMFISSTKNYYTQMKTYYYILGIYFIYL